MIKFSNIKINIGLNIISKNQNNYHNINSIFFPLPFYDILEIIKSTKFSYLNSGIKIDCELKKNTCYKAYNLLLSDFPFIKNVNIYHHKIIPTGMGLGGGSANAIEILKLLNEIFYLNLNTNKFIEYAQKIGSDCMFFLHNTPCFVSGIGNILTPINLNLKGYKIILILPKNISINTAWAYSKITPKQINIDLKEVIKQPINEWKNYLKNDFEDIIFENYINLKDIKKYLYNQGALYSSMSGSGASIYGIFNKETKINTKLIEENNKVCEINL